MRTRIFYPGLHVRVETNDKRLTKLWVEPPGALITAVGVDVFARFARAFNVAERIEGVTHAMSVLLMHDEPGIQLDTARSTLVKIFWGYLYEAAKTIKELKPVRDIVRKSPAEKSWTELRRMADIWIHDARAVIRHEFAFHPGDLKHYRAAARELLTAPAQLELLIEQGSEEEGMSPSGGHAYPFAFQLLSYGMRFDKDDAKRERLAKQSMEEMRQWMSEAKYQALSLPLHLSAVFVAVLHHHGVRVNVPEVVGPVNDLQLLRTLLLSVLIQRP